MSHAGMTPESAALMKEGNTLPDVAPNPLPAVNHTLGGFRGAFYVIHRRAPTEQEIFDAGVRSGIEREQLYIAAALA